MADQCLIGFDLGGTKMLATVFNMGFEALGSSKKKPGELPPSPSWSAVFRKLWTKPWRRPLQG